MAKIRAYKIAEELGIDRNELVERAKSLGVEVPGPMASLDEDVAALLRERLGGHAPGAQVTERRVEAQGGGAVIRRRKRAPEPAPAPAPAPVRVEAPSVEVAPEPEPIEETPSDRRSRRRGGRRGGGGRARVVRVEPRRPRSRRSRPHRPPQPRVPASRCAKVRAERSIVRPISAPRRPHRARARSASAYAKW